jgi:addiction module RelE/StbE family toxin
MSYRIIWSPQALKDLNAIMNYIQQHNPSAASSIRSHFVEAIQNLRRFPQMYRVVPELRNHRIREITTVRPYRIIYCLEETTRTIKILRIWHAKRGTPVVNLRQC